ncbi:hypothetical protein JVU11DRAFT_3571 [Chiua virens]|nr:hypothetical protein JVU11DRAFT_3571 [Chiua virens]
MSSLRRSYTLLRDLSVLRSSLRKRYSTLAEDVRSDATFRIPIIDFSAFHTVSTLSEKRRIADEIVNGFKEVGFVYLSGHGIPQGVIDTVYKKVRSLSEQPSQDQVAWDDPCVNRGYVRTGRERATQSSDVAEIAALRAKAPDTKESMEIGRDCDPVRKNKWVKEADSPGFKDTMLEFFQAAVMRSIALGLDLQESFFDRKIDQQCHTLRLLSYPSIRTTQLLQEGQARVGAHSDYGTITLLFQDSIGGLEVQNPHTQHFQPAHPIPGTVVVNAGDLLAHWSNDVLRSTLHRVVAPLAQKTNDRECTIPVRQSIAFFCHPNFGAMIESLPTCVTAMNPSKYKPVTTEEYIVGRLAATYD